jgi:hypothetical protein
MGAPLASGAREGFTSAEPRLEARYLPAGSTERATAAE